MKNLLKIIIAVYTLITFSCTSEDLYLYETNDNLSLDKINNVINLSGQSQIIAYKMLNNNEKVHIWKTKLTQLINSKKLNDIQTSYVKELNRTLNLENFSGDNSGIYYSEYLNEMKKIGATIFSIEEMQYYFSSINHKNIKQKYIKLMDDNEGAHCNCNSTDDWCPWGSKCLRWGCSTRDSGCGWWMAEICNGVCVS